MLYRLFKLFCFALCCLWVLVPGGSYAQAIASEHQFTRQQLKQDLAYLQQQLFTVHAYPYTELSPTAYQHVFEQMQARLPDSATATDFYKIIKPAVSYLSDEHAALSLSLPLLTQAYREDSVFLPFSLSRSGKTYRIAHSLLPQSNLQAGTEVTHINSVPVAELVNKCIPYASGFPDGRAATALQQFGYLYTWSQPQVVYIYHVRTGNGKTISLKGIPFKTWQVYRLKLYSNQQNGPDRITYTSIGRTGYIHAYSFDTRNDKDFDSLSRQIAGIFRQIHQDHVQNLFIDVSRNGGGNSSVGDVLINYISGKPYRGYQCNFKRSDDYARLMKSWGITDSAYLAHAPGTVIHYASSLHTPPAANPDRFTGPVYVVIGDGTFSSAMMFATIIKDNHIATLVGQVPQDGHPSHFGEVYNTQLPNTKIDLRFGVKEWIRPAGKNGDNYLYPDKPANLKKLNTPQALIHTILP